MTMGTSGPVEVTTPRSTRAEATRRLLIDAAIRTLQERGYPGASARVIADRAGVNQGLIFYHFDSVIGLLLAALDTVSARRQTLYGDKMADARSPAELVALASSIFHEDLDAGYATVLVAMIAGAATTAGLGEQVAERIAPWTAAARDAVTGALADSPLARLVPADSVGFAVVALYLGMEMLTHLDGDRAPATELFERALGLFTLLGAVVPGATSGVPST
jgi:AcrR family transcriptional regulator